MLGTILHLNQNRGIIKGDDENRYYFQPSDCLGFSTPTIGLRVDFIVDGTNAIEIFLHEVQSVPESTLTKNVSVSGKTSTNTNKKLVYNIPGVIASIIFLISLIIPYAILDYSAILPFTPIIEFKLTTTGLGIILIAGGIFLLATFAAGLNWNWLLWTLVAVICVSIYALVNNESLYSAVSNLRFSLQSNSQNTYQLPSYFDFIKPGFYLHILSLFSLSYLIVFYKYEARTTPVLINKKVANIENLKEAASDLKSTLNNLNISKEGFQHAGETIETMIESTERKHSVLFNFIRPYLNYIDSGNFFKKPFYWLYTITALIYLLIPVIVLFFGTKSNIFDMPFKYALAFILIWILMCISSWIVFQLWWDRKDKVLSAAQLNDDFVATPVFSHYIQTSGESAGTYLAILGTGATLITTIVLGSEVQQLNRQIIGFDFLTGGSFLLIFVWPLVGFSTIIFSRFLAEILRALVSIANNTKPGIK
ncbi:hypothetical protein [Emticicia soli]|uniref:Uncharacterized protein n=1 Tax=Emticicia soli TaxID=2027878 RepID=A0ABW5J2V5_9BACT